MSDRRLTTGSRESAFTLIEMIVVLVLVAIMMPLAFPAIGHMRASSARSTASSQADGEAKVAARMLKADIREAQGARSGAPAESMPHLLGAFWRAARAPPRGPRDAPRTCRAA